MVLINDWEGRSPEFLSNVFDGDAADIVKYISDSSMSKIMEIGFGNNRLLPKILGLGLNLSYFGLDKTQSFVSRAKTKFDLPKVSFYKLDIEDLNHLNAIVHNIKPDILILRYILEHVPGWRESLQCINELGIPSLLISLYTETKLEVSQSNTISTEVYEYTENSISGIEMSEILSNYKMAKLSEYDKVIHTLRIYEKTNV